MARTDGTPRGHAGSPPPRLLLVLSSANQLYSGTGRVIFETIGRLVDDFQVEVAIDDGDARAIGLCAQFCDRTKLELHVLPHSGLGRPDHWSEALSALLHSGTWNLVMAVSWANAATNRIVLRNLDDVALAYLPLHQPSWSIPLDDATRADVDEVHRAMLSRADVVFCLTPWERATVSKLIAPASPTCGVVAPGCDFELFRPGPVRRRPDILFVGDLREPRKRFDRVVATLGHLQDVGCDARLVVAGNQTDAAAQAVPPRLSGSMVALGYVSDTRLSEAYRDAAVLLLLSDYEAFGLPILEALASATSVVVSDLAPARSAFAHIDGVHFVNPDDHRAIADRILEVLARGAQEHAALAAQRIALAERFSWASSAGVMRDHLLAAWARRARAVNGFLPLPLST